MKNLSYKQTFLISVLITACVLITLVWLLPLSGQVIISPTASVSTNLWPQFIVEPAVPKGGDTVTFTVTDTEPWSHVRLVVNGESARLSNWASQPGLSGTTWVWTSRLPKEIPPRMKVDLYSDCHTGCQLRGRTHLPTVTSGSSGIAISETKKETKLCVLFPDPERDWHGRSGWVVDMTYARWADSSEDEYWTVDQLAARVHHATEKGLHVLVRVDFDKGQTLPPANDLLALDEYLAYMRRLARDERLQDVDGYIIGSSYNALDSNALDSNTLDSNALDSNALDNNITDPNGPITPEWYARIFNGYGESAGRLDNVIQTVRRENPLVHVLVGPLRPWSDDQSGSIAYEIDVPWLSYMNTVVARLAESAADKAAIGDVHALPDGFAIGAPGRVTAPELTDAAQEPQTDLTRPEWGNAQAGFRIYRDFLAIINASSAMQGRPVYISTTNTFTPDEGILPAQNYPAGWLENALEEVNKQPQIQTLCWFLDLVPGDNQWDTFSLTRKPAAMQDASDDFETLLQQDGLE